MHVIYQVGAQEEPMQSTSIIGTFNNQCSCIVREKVPITYENWKTITKLLKDFVWGEMKMRFTYPKGYDEENCKQHVMYLVGKSHRQFRFILNKEYMKIGKTPFDHYNFIMHDVWKVFANQKQREEAKAKGKKFSKLAQRNVHHHHLA